MDYGGVTMKALIRNPGETILESDSVPGIEWGSGYPLTASGWAGGPYTLIENYVYEVEHDLDYINRLREQLSEEEPEVEDCEVEEADYIEIDGKRYSKEELRRLIE